MTTSRPRATRIGIGISIGAALAVTVGIAPAAAVDPADLEERVTVDAVVGHLQQLQDIADANGGNRAAGTSGYEASAAYIEQALTAAGYTPERQYFDADLQTIDAYTLTVDGYSAADPFGIPMEFTPGTPAGGLSDLPLIAPTAPLGCTADDWAGIDAAGAIALVSRGSCSFAEKSAAAAAAGAEAVIIYNNEPGPLQGTLGAQTPDLAPTVGILQSEGQDLLAALADGPVLADLDLQQHIDSVETFNIIADTPTGRDDNVVMLGAHLDSVEDGPGINDNGSGSAAILEVALQLAASGELENTVRFAWWGAEEIGLLGSAHYVEELTDADADAIATYLNFDMVASPNYVIAVYDADQSTYEAPVEVPEGSIATEAAFTSYFDAIGQPWIDTAFDARSDYNAFILAGIPASGLFTGADDVKTAEQVALFGGTEGIIMDPNYHTPADDMSNINTEALGIMLGAIASVTATLANDTSAVNGVAPIVDPVVPAPEVTEEGDHLLAASGSEISGVWLGGGVLALLAGAVVLAAAARRRRTV
ncbi:Zn-dependent M28 family amino/carboxypeptidase [Microbacterium sp. SORGH_AS428]|uniref:M20/M25/M40 family metallo-hydrolase n=1 Tax=Microbacterium sp. SORGH_AS_0428 TaxID=3041788 RepID=UPI0028584EB8|nr:M20/M25/M40 family metallo-hydrolase [Microbacterium sp. SORGH_AS_0428]MDR6198775.1 Zn-dependent M28 family amino/carboxypeptidase [Microbacterium sp. SORGH_AS_0428]